MDSTGLIPVNSWLQRAAPKPSTADYGSGVVYKRHAVAVAPHPLVHSEVHEAKLPGAAVSSRHWASVRHPQFEKC